MLNLLVRYRIVTNRGSGIISGHYIEVYWDDDNSVVVVYDYDDASDTTPTTLTSGPDLGAINIDHEPVTQVNPIPYSFCDSLDLQSFVTKSTFPYVNKISSPNHFACTSSVCDLQINDNPSIQPATDFVTPNGSIQGSATSSNPPIKYDLNPNFDYDNQGFPTFEFYDLFPGDYTITAKDALGCIDQITVTVPVPDFYGVLYRLEYSDINNTPTRIDILERGYSGEIIPVCGGSDDPFVLKYNGDGEINKFTPIIPSQATLTLLSRTNFYFSALRSQDERKYQMRYYKDYGSIVSPFTPAVLPDLDDWINSPNPSISGWDWNTGATPTVNFGNAGTGFSHGLNTRSDLLYTDYTFETGQSYSFGYEFIGITSPSGWSPVNATYKIQIVDASKNVLIEKNIPYIVSDGASIGTYDFVAPNNASGIAVVVFVSSAGSQHTYTIQSFTNETQSEAGGDAGFELKWLGYVISSNNSEAYIAPPYPVTVVATDGLADLKNYDFLDSGGNVFRDDTITLVSIRYILSKTDLGINIQSAVNRFEEDMDSGLSDDPLMQCKFNPGIFYDGENVSNCSDVLTEILKPFGARILQRNGVWLVYCVEEFVTSSAFREFDSNGLFVDQGTINDIVDLDVPVVQQVAAFRNRDQVLEFLPAYGRMFFQYTLKKNESLVKSYGFELEDTYQDPTGLILFKNWNVNISNAPGAIYGIKKTESLEGNYNFFITNFETLAGNSPQNPPRPSKYIQLSAANFPIEYNGQDLFEFRFNYSVILQAHATIRQPLWVRIRWTLQVGSYYYNLDSDGWSTDANYSKNNLIISSYNQTSEFKVVSAFRDIIETTTETVTIHFYLEAGGYKDFTSFATLRDITTNDKAPGYKVKGEDFPDKHYYTLDEGTDSESVPGVIRPNDFNASTNPRVWRLDRIVPPNGEIPINYYYLDNVTLLNYPNGAEPPESITIQRDNNPGIKVDFEETYLLNDVDIDNINNSERTYKNYFKKLDGTPTQVWERTYRTGTGKLLDLHSADFFSQYKLPSNKLTGSLISDVEVLPTSVLNEVNDGGKKYMFMGYELHDKEYSIGFDLHEIKDVITDDGSGNIDAEFNTDYSLDFNS